MLVAIEGNIGSGKSSVLELLSSRLEEVAVHQEPIDEWGDLLDLYYADPPTWSLAFNLKVLHSFATIQRNDPQKLQITERSPAACRHVFGQLAYNDNHLSPAAWEVFKDFHDLLGWEPDLYVYIDTPPDRCFRRMTTRGRECEAGVTTDYLSRIEFQYENMLRFTKVPVVRVDGTQPLGSVVDDIVKVFKM